ncbi:thiamine pyrophosphate-binding protein [Novispirillum itersonii]|uniref:thiamine pyrophosphate-binding protein n=1 Tax=Novispirillum itersonii TaxID=189 RepID=UPI0003795A5F|nr:thiamine pyrophosphate-binding protein [Novispirillum itersonii]
MIPKTAAQVLVETLALNGATKAFGVPGESYLAVLDALVDSDIEFINARQEGGAAMMAAAHGRMTGQPGICMVTRGPGATNASAGVHVAFQDSIPMILFIGQVARDQADREAFQEIDYRRMFGQMAKWVAQIDDASRMAEYISRAYHTATSGRPGPVVLALPEDMLHLPSPMPALTPYRRAEAAPTPQALLELSERLAKAEKPFLLIGGGGWDQETCEILAGFATQNNLPVGVSFRCQDLIDNDHPNYVGHVGIGIDPNLAKTIRESDLLLVLGARLGEMTTSSYELLVPPRLDKTLIHIHASAEELGRVYQPDLPINADVRSATRALANLGRVWGGDDSRVKALRANFEAFTTPTQVPGPVNMGEAIKVMDSLLPKDSILCNGAGNYAIWLHRFHRYHTYGGQLAPTCGSMGFGTPAAVAASIADPSRVAVAFSGDGCFQMTLQEFAVAVQYGTRFIQVVVNNGMYGTIRMHQERTYPGRVSGTRLSNPDFAAMGRAMGGNGEVVERTEDFGPAFARALASDRPTLIEVRVDPEALTPAATLSGTRDAALKAKGKA